MLLFTMKMSKLLTPFSTLTHCYDETFTLRHLKIDVL